MWIVRLALRRPYTFIVMAMLIAIGGVLTIARTPTPAWRRFACRRRKSKHTPAATQARNSQASILGPAHSAHVALVSTQLAARPHVEVVRALGVPSPLPPPLPKNLCRKSPISFLLGPYQNPRMGLFRPFAATARRGPCPRCLVIGSINPAVARSAQSLAISSASAPNILEMSSGPPGAANATASPSR